MKFEQKSENLIFKKKIKEGYKSDSSNSPRKILDSGRGQQNFYTVFRASSIEDLITINSFLFPSPGSINSGIKNKNVPVIFKTQEV